MLPEGTLDTIWAEAIVGEMAKRKPRTRAALLMLDFKLRGIFAL